MSQTMFLILALFPEEWKSCSALTVHADRCSLHQGENTESGKQVSGDFITRSFNSESV